MSSARIPSLDGLRAISIFLVLLGHLHGTRGFPDMRLREWLGDYANLGVLVFFVISGFLITSLLLNETVRTGDISLLLFYARRGLRIFPAYYAFLIAVIALSLGGVIELQRYDLLTAFTYTVNYYADRSWFIGHLWSLSVEEQFYLLWPLTLKSLGARRAIWAAAGVFFLSPIVRGAMHVLILSDARDLPVFPAVAGGIAAGSILAGLRPFLLSQRWYLAVTGSYFMALMPVMIVLCNRTRDHTIGTVFGEPIIYVCIAVLVDSCSRHSENWFGRLLNSSLMMWVGTLSYSLYLWQQLFLNRHSEAIVNAFPLNIICATAAAVLSYYCLERPLIGMRKRFTPVSKGTPATHAAMQYIPNDKANLAS